MSSMQSMMPPAPSLSSTSNSRSSSGDTNNKKRNKKHAEDTTKRLYTIYEQVFFEQYNMWFLCLMDRAESTEVISLAFRLFIEILQNTESNTQERHIQFMLLQFEYALTQHCHSFDIYILLIAFLVGVPVKMLPQNMFESKSAVDVTSILNQFKAASAATETSINILKDEDANAIMSMISNLLREHLRKATFPEYNKAYGGSPKRTVFHRRGGSTDSGYYGENAEGPSPKRPSNQLSPSAPSTTGAKAWRSTTSGRWRRTRSAPRGATPSARISSATCTIMAMVSLKTSN